jgi:peptide/nickel transport system substrate-binding protein
MSLKYPFKLVIAYFSRFKLIIFIGALIGVTAFLLLSVLLPKIYEGKTEVVGITGRYRPDNLPEEILKHISHGLTRLENYDIEPDLAQSWETPDKGKTWVFKLKNDIYWQDGDKVTSYDISYGFSDVSIDRPDDTTLIFTLEKGPYSPFPTVLTKPVFKKGLLGTGDWEVKKISIINTFVQEMVLVREKNIKHYKFYPTIDRTKLAYKLGRIDQISDVLDPAPFDSWNNSNITSATNHSQVVTLFFNTQDSILSDKSLRQALFYAIDKNALGERAESPINPDSWAYNPQLKTYDYDAERAKEMIDALSDEFKEHLEIKLVSTPSLLSVAEKISNDWEAIGVKNQILVSSIIPSDFQAFLTIFDIPSDPDQYPIWHSTQSETNLSKYTNPRIDKLLEDGRMELDPEERRKIYLDFQRFIVEDAPAAFLYHPNYYTITRR